MKVQIVRRICWAVTLGCVLSGLLMAGPVEFGLSEFREAAREAGINVSVETELSQDPPRHFRIQVFNSGNGRVSGGDLRGLMYGLLEAAEQIRTDGKLTPTRGSADTQVRGVRMEPALAQANSPDYFSRLVWRANFRILARSRINQLTLSLPLEAARIEDLCELSEMANDHGIDFILGVQAPLPNPDRLYASLREILDHCVYIRAIEMEAHDPREEPVHLFTNTVIRALGETGHRVALDLHGIEKRPDLSKAAIAAGIPLRLSAEPEGGQHSAVIHSVLHDVDGVQKAEDVRARIISLMANGYDGFEINTRELDLADQEAFFRAWGWIGFDLGAELRPVQ